VPPPPPPPPEDPLPERVEIVFDSKPRGAKVIDLATNQTLGKTPTSFEIPGSKTPRQFKFELRGHGDSIVELVPDRAKIEYAKTLVKGAAASDVVTHVPSPTTRPPDPVTKPDPALVTKPSDVTKPADTTKPAEITKPADTTKPADPVKPSEPAIKKPPDPPKDDCPEDEVPCLKGFHGGR
jgi:hypothetical protein